MIELKTKSLETKDECETDRECGTLDCPVRPEFFVGQLLKEDDLDALVQWTRDRLRLTRLRDGWGVVCGMEVTYDGRDQRRPLIKVSPGYAVNCCGDDIVACDPLSIDLRKWCREQACDCTPANNDDIANSPALRWLNENGGKELLDERLDCLVCADVRVFSKEEFTHPQVAKNGNCNNVCHYSRVQEKADVELVRVESTNDNSNANLRLAYQRLKQDLRGQKAPARREAILQYLRRYPPGKYACLYEMVRAPDDKITDETYLKTMLDMLSAECETSVRQCEECTDNRVTLARVWICVPKNDPKCCTVIAIDQQPPYRQDYPNRQLQMTPMGKASVEPEEASAEHREQLSEESIFSMEGMLQEINGVGPAFEDYLIAQEIKTIEELLNHCATKVQRVDLQTKAKRSNSHLRLDEKEMLSIALQAELMRLPGIEEHAFKLVDKGNIFAKLREMNAGQIRALVSTSVPDEIIKLWVQLAGKLEVVVQDEPEGDS